METNREKRYMKKMLYSITCTVCTQLLKDLEKLMYPSKVNIRCPLEMSQDGKLPW